MAPTSDVRSEVADVYHIGAKFGEDGRPCKVLSSDGEHVLWVNGLCHMIYVRSWIHMGIMVGDASGQESDAFAAIELEDGMMFNTRIANVRLLDSKEKFAQYYWGDVDD